MKNTRLLFLGIFSLIPYLYALRLQDLRANTIGFVIAFFAAFALYVLAVIVVLRGDPRPSPRPARPGVPLELKGVSAFHFRPSTLAIAFLFAIVFNAILVFTPPTLSDDMYRYVWDGRVQAHQIDPYAYPPDAPQLASLRDTSISTHINRPEVVTVYPAGAELAFAAAWRIIPDNVRWFQILMASGSLLAGILLVYLLRSLGKPEEWALIYLWSPLVIFETAHSAHVDGLVLPLLVGAWLARVQGRDGWVGLLLGAATAVKLYPALLLPALWRARDDRGRRQPAWQMPLAFAGAFALPYLPFLSQGGGVVGFLPGYLNERFNMGLASLVTDLVERPPAPIFQTISRWFGGSGSHAADWMLLFALALVGLAILLRPAHSGEQAIARSVWLIGAFTLFTQNLFAWYMLWLVPLLAIFLPGRKNGLAFDAWTGWFLFTGLVALSYTFFITWTPVPWAQWLEFAPLYAFLILPPLWHQLCRFGLAGPGRLIAERWDRNA